jgi:regulation of enolase protein 1 (concanavalin A-like superfamily)
MISLVPTVSAQTLSGGWTATNIGSPALSGSASFNGSVFTVSAAGLDIAGTSDQFVFTYRTIDGDGDVVARVNSLTATNAWAKSGVMIRGSLAANAPHVYAATSPASGAAMQYRSTAGGSTTTVSSAGGGAPMWLKVERRGSTLSTYRSADGLSWQQIGVVSMSLPSTVYVGVAVTSHNAAARTTSQVGNVSVAPAGWQATDIGGPAAGNNWFSGGTFAGYVGGNTIGGASDRFRYAYRQFTGDVDIVSRVDSAQNVAIAGVMIRGSLAANSAHASMLTSAGGGQGFYRRRSNGAGTVASPISNFVSPVWVKVQKRGSTLTVFQSRDGGSTWRAMASDTIALPTTFYVGLAGASNSSGVSMVTWSNTTVTGQAATPSQPPAVSLTSPAAGSTFTAPATITVNANASDADGTVSSVQFRAGSTVIGTDTTSPYSVNWTGVAAGSYTLTAVATDNSGATTTSSSVNVTVGSAANQQPTVSITSPASGSTFASPASMTLTASASDPDGSVVRVDFRAGATALGSDTSSPFSFAWNNVAAGTYSITAVATDNAGATRTSAPITVTVGDAANQAPTVSLTTPAAGSVFDLLDIITITAAASDPDGTIARVEFYAAGLLLGTDTSSPYSFTWLNLPLGAVSLMAVAYDNDGAMTSSAQRLISVGEALSSANAVFVPSADHATVSTYLFKVFLSSVDPNTAIPVLTHDLGKPAVVNGEITADVSPVVALLPAGTYVATVSAVSSGGTSASAPSAPFTR